MAEQQKTKKTRRRKPSYVGTIFSIAMVLFVVGLLAAFILQARMLTNYFKESLEIQLELADGMSDTDIMQLKTKIEGQAYVKKARFVSKEEALQMLQEQTGENTELLIDDNPLYDAIVFNMKAQYANSDSISWIETSLLSNPKIKDFNYADFVIELFDQNIKKISLIVGIFALLLLFIAISIIDNTIRLSMYSQRFLIKSMQLVGATKWFITKPFLMRGISNGLVAGILASLAIMGLLIFVKRQMPDFPLMQDLPTFAVIIGLVIGVGILISWLSTTMAVRKYLRLKLDDLY